MIRLYAAWGEALVMSRTGHPINSMIKAKALARKLSLTHPAAEIRQCLATGGERLVDTYVGGRSIAE